MKSTFLFGRGITANDSGQGNDQMLGSKRPGTLIIFTEYDAHENCCETLN